MVEENNALLRKMRRSALLGRIFHILYWVVIFGFSVGAYYLIQPYVDQVKGIYTGVQTDVGNVKNAASQLGNIGDIFN